MIHPRGSLLSSERLCLQQLCSGRSLALEPQAGASLALGGGGRAVPTSREHQAPRRPREARPAWGRRHVGRRRAWTGQRAPGAAKAASATQGLPLQMADVPSGNKEWHGSSLHEELGAVRLISNCECPSQQQRWRLACVRAKSLTL